MENGDSEREIFTDEDAFLISGIYLSKMHMHDKLVWKESESSEFSVKTGYTVARKVVGKEFIIDGN